MPDLIVLYTTVTVFGLGVTIVDFLGIMDHAGEHHGAGDGDITGSEAEHSVSAHNGSYLVSDNKASNPKQTEKPGIKIIAKIMIILRSAVYFSLGFGPTGLFANFRGLPRINGLFWACGVGACIMILARLLRRFIRRDLDSSIKPDELLQEKGVLLLPLEGGAISKATVRQFGREMEIYVRCMDANVKLPKGKEITVVDYDNDVYWVEPAKDKP